MSKWSRFGWGSIAVLFLATFVIGAVGFLISSLQNKPNSNQTANNNCQFSASVPAPKLASPTVQPAGKVSSLKTTDLVNGSGATATPGSCLTIKYYGALASNGKEFDQDYNVPLGLQFPLGESYVVPGMDQGLIGMKVGGTRELFIPSSLGYGAQAQGPIPANSDLIFIVKLVSIK